MTLKLRSTSIKLSVLV